MNRKKIIKQIKEELRGDIDIAEAAGQARVHKLKIETDAVIAELTARLHATDSELARVRAVVLGTDMT